MARVGVLSRRVGVAVGQRRCGVAQGPAHRTRQRSPGRAQEHYFAIWTGRRLIKTRESETMPTGDRFDFDGVVWNRDALYPQGRRCTQPRVHLDLESRHLHWRRDYFDLHLELENRRPSRSTAEPHGRTQSDYGSTLPVTHSARVQDYLPERSQWVPGCLPRNRTWLGELQPRGLGCTRNSTCSRQGDVSTSSPTRIYLGCLHDLKTDPSRHRNRRLRHRRGTRDSGASSPSPFRTPSPGTTT